MKKIRLLFGISVFWLALSVLFDGINTLLLPGRLLHFIEDAHKATILGLLSFAGLLAGMLIQPVAGAASDWLRSRWGRRGMLAVGVLLTLVSLIVFGSGQNLAALALGYLLVQSSASVAQAAQQGFIPDLIPARRRGVASGLKSFMDIGGAMIGFVLLGQLLGAGQEALATPAIAALLVLAFLLTILLVREQAAQIKDPHQSVPGSVSLLDAFRIDLRQHRGFTRLVVSRFFFLLGTYAVGRFLLYFVADRLQLNSAQASEQAGYLLAGLALLTVLTAPLAGWAADRLGRKPVMLAGSFLSAAGVLLLIFAGSAWEIFLFGTLLSLGSAAFTSGNWAMTADVIPKDESARFFGLANFGTAGAAAAAGLLGPLIDGFNRFGQGNGYTVLFLSAGVAFLASAFSLRGLVPDAWVKPSEPLDPSLANTFE